MPTHAPATPPTPTRRGRVRRIEVRPADAAGDPRGQAVAAQARALGMSVASVRTARVYLVQADLDDAQWQRVADGLLADPVLERAREGAAGTPPGDAVLEVHPLAGVMDPAAGSVREAIAALTGVDAAVSTGWRYELAGVSQDEARRLAERLLANPVVQAIHTEAYWPDALPEGHPTPFRVTRVDLTGLDDAALTRLSREAHLFLSLDEMRAIRDHYRSLGREPTDVELETLAQTWSEHCVHKTLKSTIRYREEETERHRDGETALRMAGRPGHEVQADGTVVIHNLLKSTVAAATHELIADGVDWTLSVFVDNAGVIAFDDDHAVCVKVETHNHPSAIEPYGGAATGIGGCIRDVIGTGLGARPIASTDVFCVAPPGLADVPEGCLPPRRVLTEVVAGVRDYGNRMGIPTVNGAVWFDPRHVGNPLVFCGCVGLMPRGPGDAMIRGKARPGDRIVALGGRTGRDGIHGATFSSAELTETHADEFAHAVQIGNAIEEKRTLDAILRARDFVAGQAPGTGHQASGRGPVPGARCLFHAITDCGAGGFSSAVGEMGEELGAEVHLDRAPLKYAGLTYTEIWISEAQERMVLAVPEANLPALAAICAEERVELADLGRFGTPGAELVLRYHDHEVGRLSMDFLHNGIPMPTREAVWVGGRDGETERRRDAGKTGEPSIEEALLRLLAHPNIASKHWIIRQYDHEVQGNVVVKPLVGPRGRGPSDASVIEPVPGTGRGLAIACGLATGLEHDPYRMALAAIDECVRNLVCVGADPDRIAILDNFCWPGCDDPRRLAGLVRAAEGCYDGAKAYRTPFVSGKDSLNNQFTTTDGRTIAIPPTLLISGIGIVPDVRRCVTSDAKRAGNHLLLVTGSPDRGTLGGSHYARLLGLPDADAAAPPDVDLRRGPAAARLVASLVAAGLVRSAHDVSDGGLLVAVAEMLIGARNGSPLGASITLDASLPAAAALFAEPASTYVLEVEAGETETAERQARQAGVEVVRLGTLTEVATLTVRTGSGSATLGVDQMADAWRAPLDW